MGSPIKCMVVDDEPLAIELLSKHIQQCPQLILVATADNPLTAIEILKTESVDLVFLDIQMPVLTGVELVKILVDPPSIIFTTAYREYAVESYELNVVDYLLKPITFIRFLKAIEKYTGKAQNAAELGTNEMQEKKEETSLYVNVNKRYVKILFDEITYIESVKDYVHIHFVDNTVITKDSISQFELKLPSHFLRIHRSFIINKKKITAFTSQDVEIGEKEIPIGGSYKEATIKELKSGK